MKTQRIQVSRKDFDCLVDVLKEQLLHPIASRERFHDLTAALVHCDLTDTVIISPEVVTMNSTVRLTDVNTDEEDEYQLVYPVDADISQGKLSVLSNIGTAVLGHRKGDEVRWQVPNGEFKARITNVSQSSRKAVTA